MPRIELTIDVRDEKVRVSTPEKGTLLDLQNTVLFEEKTRSLIGVGITKEQYCSEVPNHIIEENLSMEELISETGITSRRTYAALDYLMYRSVSIIRPDIYKTPFPILKNIDLNLFFHDYSCLSVETQEKFEYELISNTQAKSYSINGKDSSPVVSKMRTAFGLRAILYFLIIPILILSFIPMSLFGDWLEQFISPSVSFIIFAILLVIWTLIIGTVLMYVKDWIWLRIVKNLIPRSVLVAEMNRSKDHSRWAKERLIRSL